MDYDILKSVSQGSDGAQDAENSRIAAIADELRRLCQLHEAQPGTGQAHVTPFEREQRMAEQMAKARGLSVPLHLLASNVLVPISDVSFYNNFCHSEPQRYRKSHEKAPDTIIAKTLR